MARPNPYVLVVLLGIFITVNCHHHHHHDKRHHHEGHHHDDHDHDHDDQPSLRNIFKPADESDISEIQNSDVPWVLPEFVPTIEDFKKNMFEDLEASPQVQEIYNETFDSQTIRRIYFKLPNKFLTDVGYPIPSALANVVSKSGSLFDPMTFPVFFEAISFNIPELFLIYNVEIDRTTSQRYVKFVEDEIDKLEDFNDAEAVWMGFLNAYANFLKSYEFDLTDYTVENDFWLLFANALIIVKEKQ